MCFRKHKIAISADIKMMYRQVKILPEQYNLQRIFWREHKNEPLKEYYINRVIYGMASASFCAVRAMIEGASTMENEFPNAVRAIKHDFYVDDGITGAKNVEEAIQLAREMKFVLEKSGFELCKFKSNSKQFCEELEQEIDSSLVLFDEFKTSVLGLKWNVACDEFTYEVKRAEIQGKLTKRILLGRIGELYDPNGFIAPVITTGKMLVQKLWLSKLDWDDPISEELINEWKSLWDTIK